MQSLGVYSCGFFIFGINIISHHTIITYRIASHHTSSCIRKRLRRNKGDCSFTNTCRIAKECDMPWHIFSMDITYYTKPTFVATSIRKILFAKHEKKGRCFFAEGSKMVCTQISCITKKYITLVYIQIFDV
jgi:hypothetical protein